MSAPHDTSVRPFRLSVPQAELDDLRRRLRDTRWPDRETVGDTSQGPKLDKVRALVEHWSTAYDWRPAEELLNGLGQHVTTIDGLDIHFLHVRSPERDALPMIMTHGWPGSVLEFRKAIGPLTDPGGHGGRAEDAFHLVIPSLPGFGFSGKPTEPGWDLRRTARAWVELMQRLGYARYVAQGGDLGAGVTEEMAVLPTSGATGLAAIHLNMAMDRPTDDEVRDATPEEQVMLAESQYYGQVLSAYAVQMSTRPQTIGYALNDSPVGLAAWIYAMFQDVGGARGDAEAVLSYEDMLDDITLYWLSGTATSAARTYWENARAGWSPPATSSSPLALPTGVTVMPQEYVRKSRRWVERRYADLVLFDEAAAGGHFALLEQPDLLVEDIRTTFRSLR